MMLSRFFQRAVAVFATLPTIVCLVASPSLAGGTSVEILDSTYMAVADHFNEASDRLLFVSILSPTCETCRHGARAIVSEILGHYQDADVDVTIVWSPMLKKDNEEAAHESAKMFDDARVTQFYDTERYVGYLYRFDVFPDAADQMAASLPEGHPFHEAMAERAETARERPEWDIYMWFASGRRWETDAPRPTRFIRQVGRWDEDGRTVSLMWVDDLTKAPVVGVLGEHMGSIMRSLRPNE
jgi:hypothetical protein